MLSKEVMRSRKNASVNYIILIFLLLAITACKRNELQDLDYYDAKVEASIDTYDMHDSLCIIVTLKNIDTIPIIYPGLNGITCLGKFSVTESIRNTFYSGFGLQNEHLSKVIDPFVGNDSILPYFYRIMPEDSLKLRIITPYYTVYDSLNGKHICFDSLRYWNSIQKNVNSIVKSGADSISFRFISFPEQVAERYLDLYFIEDKDTVFSQLIF